MKICQGTEGRESPLSVQEMQDVSNHGMQNVKEEWLKDMAGQKFLIAQVIMEGHI